MVDLLNDTNPLSDSEMGALRASIADMQAGRVSPAIKELRQ
jgi:hypothetical protein